MPLGLAAPWLGAHWWEELGTHVVPGGAHGECLSSASPICLLQIDPSPPLPSSEEDRTILPCSFCLLSKFRLDNVKVDRSLEQLI